MTYISKDQCQEILYGAMSYDVAAIMYVFVTPFSICCFNNVSDKIVKVQPGCVFLRSEVINNQENYLIARKTNIKKSQD